MYRLAFLLAALTLLLGCPTRRDDDASGPDGDLDGDLLSNSFEELIETDPYDADTDGDGWTDAEEHFTYFSPRVDTNFPYQGRYPRGPLMASDDWNEYTAEEGWAEGDISDSWTADDRWGEQIKLKRFFGQVILIDVSSEWCGPCQGVASTLNEEYTDRKEEGFIAIQVMLDGMTPGDGTPDLERWGDEFGLTNVLVGDGDRDISRHYTPAGSYGIPNYTVIGRDFTVVDWFQEGGTPNLTLIDQLLEEEPPEVEYPWPENADEIRDELEIEDLDSWIHPFDAPR
jgi:thiol-disulfide isomerase/thioredoxin